MLVVKLNGQVVLTVDMHRCCAVAAKHHAHVSRPEQTHGDGGRKRRGAVNYCGMVPVRACVHEATENCTALGVTGPLAGAEGGLEAR